MEMCRSLANSSGYQFHLIYSYNFTGCAFAYANDIFGQMDQPIVYYSPTPSGTGDFSASLDGKPTSWMQQLGGTVLLYPKVTKPTPSATGSSRPTIASVGASVAARGTRVALPAKPTVTTSAAGDPLHVDYILT